MCQTLPYEANNPFTPTLDNKQSQKAAPLSQHKNHKPLTSTGETLSFFFLETKRRQYNDNGVSKGLG
jgi:hypothetical protein